jgi:glutaredoxin
MGGRNRNIVIIFTLHGCDHCASLKEKLVEKSIPFNEIEITENQELWEKIVLQIGDEILPTTLIFNDEGNFSKIFIPGRDYQTENEIISIIKSFF